MCHNEEKIRNFLCCCSLCRYPSGGEFCLNRQIIRESYRFNMYLTWMAIIASLLMGIGALLIFIFAVKKTTLRIWRRPGIRSSGRILRS